MVGRGCLDRNPSDVESEVGRQALADPLTLRGQAGLLCNDGRVQIYHTPTFELEAIGHLVEEPEALSVAKGRVPWREVVAKVAPAGGAEQGIHDGMGQNVGVRVTSQATRV